jgi:NADH dehydrogenase FAD-containing subunit
VAASVLTPGQIGSPIRAILHKQANRTVLLGEVTGVDHAGRWLLVSDADRANARVPYDYLILATGAGPSYFGHDEFRKHAPPLKNLADAVDVRNKILSAFEVAEAEEDPLLHRDLLTFVLVGGGPTGVEMGRRDRASRPQDASQGVPQGRPGIGACGPDRPGVSAVGSISGEPFVRGEGAAGNTRRRGTVGARCGEGRRARRGRDGRTDREQDYDLDRGRQSIAGSQMVECRGGPGGRVRVQKDLSVPGHPEIFVVGDTAALEQDGRPLPGGAQVAIQQGRYAGRSAVSRFSRTIALLDMVIFPG